MKATGRQPASAFLSVNSVPSVAKHFAFAFYLTLSTIAIAAYPERPIRIVAPVAPGGAVDTVARIITPKMPALLGQNVVIDNRGGANGIIGTEIVARAPADGYTLLTTAGAHTINPAVYKKLPYDALRDFTPVIHIVNSGGLVIAEIGRAHV